MLPGVDYRQHRSLNHRAAHSPWPTRQRVSAPASRQELKNRFHIWPEITPQTLAAENP